MTRATTIDYLASVLAAVSLWAVLVWMSAPSWAAFGFAYVGFWVLRGARK